MPTTVATGMRKPRMHGTPPIWSGFTVMRENLIVGSPLGSDSSRESRVNDGSEHLPLSRGLTPGPLRQRQLRQLRPGDHEAVVGQGLVRPFLAFADGIEAIGQVAGRVAHAPELVQERRGGALALRFKGADQVL